MPANKHLSRFTQIVLLFGSFVPIALALTPLGRTSTAQDVYNVLRQQNELAPYVQKGGTAVVTGGNSGIGAETVKTLADAGMRVLLCARNVDEAKQVQESLPTEQQSLVTVQYLDLANLTSVQQAAASIVETTSELDCIINNAGLMAIPNYQTTADGIELQFGTNHVGHFYFTRLLLPHLQKESGRVVTVASTAHNFAYPTETWDSRTKYGPWGVYGQTKLANILFAKQLQTELEKAQPSAAGCCKSVSLHPGVISSPLWKYAVPSLLKPFVGLMANKSVQQGAATTIYCALARSVQGGAYYDDCQVTTPSAQAQDVGLRKDLWDYTERLLSEKGFGLTVPVANSISKEEEVFQ